MRIAVGTCCVLIRSWTLSRQLTTHAVKPLLREDWEDWEMGVSSAPSMLSRGGSLQQVLLLPLRTASLFADSPMGFVNTGPVGFQS